jgi:hypothetical protein
VFLDVEGHTTSDEDMEWVASSSEISTGRMASAAFSVGRPWPGSIKSVVRFTGCLLREWSVAKRYQKGPL